jgi:hypothetical protein
MSNPPGPWRWEKRNGFWWHIHPEQNIHDGPYTWTELNLGLGHDVHYYDRDGEPIPALVASELLADYEYKVVAKDVFVMADQPVEVSTVWLGLDHNFWPDWPGGPVKIFETMIFGGKLDLEQWRYSSEGEAIAGHTDAVKLLHAAYASPDR